MAAPGATERYALLKEVIDKKHRARIWESGTMPNALKTRTARCNWMIHPAWVER